MRLGYGGITVATEVVLFGKLGENEVFEMINIKQNGVILELISYKQ
jgi:glycopeptide antibiotics resistance protein